MGVCFTGRMLTAGQLKAALTDPSAIEDVLLHRDSHDEPDRSGTFSLDLEKSWQAMHFLLTGTLWDVDSPLGSAILGGRPIGPDQEAGSTRLLEAGEVKTIADLLVGLDIQQLRDGFDPDVYQRANIYPHRTDWHEDYVFDTYLLPALRYLTQFYSWAATHGRAVVLTLG